MAGHIVTAFEIAFFAGLVVLVWYVLVGRSR